MTSDPNNPWIDTITHEAGTETRRFPTVEHGTATVSLLLEESAEQEALYERHDGDLLIGVPTISVRVGDATVFLTWNEAKMLARSLDNVANVAYFG